MPIVVNELVFKATVADPVVRAPRPAAEARPSMDLETLVAACVEEVLRVLDARQER
jgi:hypothetical protein